jgi:PAS domain S-box-containing protein
MEMTGLIIRWRRLSLRTKGMVALTVPMLALFSALIAICWVEKAAQVADLISANAYDTRAALLQLHVFLLDADASATAYLASGDNRHLASYNSARISANQSLAQISTLVQNDAVSAAALPQIKLQTDEEMAILARFSSTIKPDRAALLERAKATISNLESGISLMDEAQQLRLVRAFYNRDLARQSLLRVVIVCGIAGPLGALFVNLLITGRMVRQLRVVGDNARRLAVGLPLEPSPDGTDEIADLGRQQEEAAHLLFARERELRESERRYRELFERSPIPYDEIDREGYVRRCNEAVSGMLRCPPEELLGSRAWDRLYPEFQGQYRDSLLNRVAEGKEIGAYECDFFRNDGQSIRVEIREHILRDEYGEPIGLCRSMLDVTERHLAAVAARKLEEYSLELHNKVEELAAALEAARTATGAKSKLLASVSHELRTPLNAIIGFSEMLYDGKLGDVSDLQREILGDVLSSGRHLLNVINEILDLSKIEAGKVDFRLERLRIADLVSEVSDVVQPLADKKQIVLSITAPGDFTAVTDALRFKQVLYNYLSNAIKFTPNGGRVKVHAAPEGDAMFRLEVEDTGVGIAPEEVPLLFQEFQQLSTRSADQGTGLGLALTRRIVEALGGHVEVRSVLGRGSVFVAVLPTEPAAANAA